MRASGHTRPLFHQDRHQSDEAAIKRGVNAAPKMQIVIKRCLLKDFSAVLDYLCDIKTTTKAILLCVAQIMEGLFLEKEGLKKYILTIGL